MIHVLILRAKANAETGYLRTLEKYPYTTPDEALNICLGYINRNMEAQYLAMSIGPYRFDADIRLKRAKP